MTVAIAMVLLGALPGSGLSNSHRCFADDEVKAEVEPKENDTAELSVAPLSHLIYPDDRPGWIDEPIANDGKDYSLVVTSGPSSSIEEADELIGVYARGAVQSYVDELVSEQEWATEPEMIPLDINWIRDELVVRRYEGVVQVGDEQQFEKAILIRIEPDDKKVFETAIADMKLKERLAATGIVILGGFSLLVGGSIVLGGLASRQKQPTAAV
ncbi:putative secreted protein [Rhodopirellula europaea SH398]|uniref:Putative secreted protein n=1 Tax=Rhodopirellula europaea SH398 TaxID=1263868 RepID=M5SF87_9BACT|nr:putative secreted protein [Rhodopirellula europaea SH398]